MDSPGAVPAAQRGLPAALSVSGGRTAGAALGLSHRLFRRGWPEATEAHIWTMM